MSNPRFTFADAAVAIRTARIKARSGGLTVAQSYEICEQVKQAREYEKLAEDAVKIAEAVKAAEKSEPVSRSLRFYDVESVDESVETIEVEELLPPERPRVAGEDEPDIEDEVEDDEVEDDEVEDEAEVEVDEQS